MQDNYYVPGITNFSLIKKLVVPIFILLCMSLFFTVEAYSLYADEYFDIEKYRYTFAYFDTINQIPSVKGMAGNVVKRVAQCFVKGKEALERNDIDRAVTQFKRISRLLPEYFHTDFIIALCLEENGDYIDAARFYKSYLKKLDKFQKGMFPMTKQIIEATVDFNITDYDNSERLIDQRMARHGIDMSKVSAYRNLTPLMALASVVIAAGLVYVFTIMPPVKRLYYRKRALLNKNKDIWICPYCGQENANINIICYKCEKGKPFTK
jgi:tetratricopeptide (TPR) repeat protein